MNGQDLNWLVHFAHLGADLVFLLVGWRLGRESAGHPMFTFAARQEQSDALREEPDPWTAAALGHPLPPDPVDSFETPERGSDHDATRQTGRFR